VKVILTTKELCAMDLMLAGAGGLTGLLVGLTGVGGGALMTPLLLMFFGFSPMTAVGTDLWFAAITKMGATRIHHGHGLIEWPVVRRLWLGSLSASSITLLGMRFYPIAGEAINGIKIAIAVTVMVTALGIIFQRPFHNLGIRLCKAKSQGFHAIQAPLTIVAGAILGVLVTLTSVGAGALGAMLLTYLYPVRLTPPRLIATDIVHAIPLALFAGIGHLLIGNIDLSLLGNLLVGSLPGVIIGAMLSSRLPHKFLRCLLAVVLLIIGGNLWWGVVG
jgi:uncharacterized membrane protein YfcA